MNLLNRTFRALVQIDEHPDRVALAFAIGVFLGFSPFLGLHTALGLLVAFTFRLNKLAVLMGVYMNNPWLVVPFYAFSTWLGLQLTGLHEGMTLPNLGFFELFGREFWAWLISQWTLLIPAILGSTILCTLLALIAYPIALHLLRKLGHNRQWRVPKDTEKCSR